MDDELFAGINKLVQAAEIDVLDEAFIDQHGLDKEAYERICDGMEEGEFELMKHGFANELTRLEPLAAYIDENKIFDVNAVSALFDVDHGMDWVRENLSKIPLCQNPEMLEPTYFMAKVLPFFLLAFKSGLDKGLDLGKASEAMRNVVLFVSFLNLVDGDLEAILENEPSLKAVFDSLPPVLKESLIDEMAVSEELSGEGENFADKLIELTRNEVARELDGADQSIIDKVTGDKVMWRNAVLEDGGAENVDHCYATLKMLRNGEYKKVAAKMLGLIVTA